MKRRTKGRAAGHSPPAYLSCDHHGQQEIRVGPFVVRAGGTSYFRTGDFGPADLIIPLTIGALPFEFGMRYDVLAAPMQDYGGVPEYWKEFLERVIEELADGRKILAFCVGSHGRTGTFLASLIALLEDELETPDPIKAARERHCGKAVETFAQAEAIFALRGAPLPEQYRVEFTVQNPPGSGPQPYVP